MTNNDTNNERENEMFDDFETQVHPEETNEYFEYIAREELEAIEEEMESLDFDLELDTDDELIDFDISFDDMVDSFNQFDDQRDLDFYES